MSETTDKTKSDTVEVRLRGHQEVRYDQTVTMPRAEFENLLALQAKSDGDVKAERKLGEIVDGWLDHEEADDFDDLEDVEVEEAKKA